MGRQVKYLDRSKVVDGNEMSAVCNFLRDVQPSIVNSVCIHLKLHVRFAHNSCFSAHSSFLLYSPYILEKENVQLYQ